jgi:hypothetical protein
VWASGEPTEEPRAAAFNVSLKSQRSQLQLKVETAGFNLKLKPRASKFNKYVGVKLAEKSLLVVA